MRSYLTLDIEDGFLETSWERDVRRYGRPGSSDCNRLRDESHSDWHGGIKISLVTGPERVLRRQESIQFGDVLDMGVRGKDASRGLMVFAQVDHFTRMERLEEKWAGGKKIKDRIWDILFLVPVKYPGRRSVTGAVKPWSWSSAEQSG